MGPIAAALILLTPYSGHAVLLTGTILTALVAVKLVVLGTAAVIGLAACQHP